MLARCVCFYKKKSTRVISSFSFCFLKQQHLQVRRNVIYSCIWAAECSGVQQQSWEPKSQTFRPLNTTHYPACQILVFGAKNRVELCDACVLIGTWTSDVTLHFSPFLAAILTLNLNLDHWNPVLCPAPLWQWPKVCAHLTIIMHLTLTQTQTLWTALDLLIQYPYMIPLMLLLL